VLSGGLSTARTVTDTCFSMNNPQLAVTVGSNAFAGSAAGVTAPRLPGFCHVILPFASQTQLKFSGAYPLPWDFQASATYQNLPGISISSSFVATNAQIRPSLGRNLGQCGTSATCNATATIDLIEPNTVREDRIQQLDVRLSRIFTLGKMRLQGNFDIFNALNASPILSDNTRYGTSWLQPTEILAARIVKFGAQLSF